MSLIIIIIMLRRQTDGQSLDQCFTFFAVDMAASQHYNLVVDFIACGSGLIIDSLFSRATSVSWYQKVKTSLDLNEAKDYGFWDAVASA